MLDESKLQYTLPIDKEAIVNDKDTKAPIAIILRDFAKDYYDNLIRPWSTELVTRSLKRRSHYVLRNDPGRMARTDISPGQRSGSLFGLVRNLRRGPRLDLDLKEHQYNISSLFGFFYALVRGTIPFISESFEEAVSGSDIPRLDPTEIQQFSLPFTDNDITYFYHPLAPPEGYISHNFSRGIHFEEGWEGCPWGVFGTCSDIMPMDELAKSRVAAFSWRPMGSAS